MNGKTFMGQPITFTTLYQRNEAAVPMLAGVDSLNVTFSHTVEMN